MMNVITLCSGYDSQCMALERIKSEYGLDYNLVAWSEIDKYACQAHDAVFPQFKGRNLGDMTTIDWSQIKEDIDLLIYSTPCQSISNAGLQHGFAEGSGTRSSIIWSTLNAIDVLRPKYLLLENVKAMVSKKFMPDFKLWCKALEERGYTNFWQVLNAKNYGIPQNRERVFLLSTRDQEEYEFPKPFELEKRLKDVLEKDVDESYYLSKKMIDGFSRHNRNHNKKGTGFIWKPKTGEDIANCLRANAAIAPTDNTYAEPISCAMRGRNSENPSDRTSGIPTEQRIELSDDIANCITTVQKDSMVAEPISYRIRKLTPREVFRLMGVTDEDINKIQSAGISKTQQYKMAGNSIVVDVLFHIFRKLFIDKEVSNQYKQLKLF